MKAIWIIARKELAGFFDSLTAYILIVLFLGFSGFFTWLYGSDVFFSNQASIRPFFDIAYFTLFFFIPALTMRMLAEEKKTGTIELLLTKSVTDWQVVIGKFLACLMLILIAVAFTLPWYFTVSWLGEVDHGAVWTGYLGIVLLSAAYIGIGLFASSITDNQIVAFLLALSIGVFFFIIFQVLSGSTSGILSQIFYKLSISSHYESISRGVVDIRDVLYFLSIAVIGLFLAEASLTRRNIVE